MNGRSSPKSLERVCEITGKKLQQCYDVDIRDRPALETVFNKHKGKYVPNRSSNAPCPPSLKRTFVSQDRCCYPLRWAQGGGRIGPRAARLLRKQLYRHPQPAQGATDPAPHGIQTPGKGLDKARVRNRVAMVQRPWRCKTAAIGDSGTPVRVPVRVSLLSAGDEGARAKGRRPRSGRCCPGAGPNREKRLQGREGGGDFPCTRDFLCTPERGARRGGGR